MKSQSNFSITGSFWSSFAARSGQHLLIAYKLINIILKVCARDDLPDRRGRQQCDCWAISCDRPAIALIRTQLRSLRYLFQAPSGDRLLDCGCLW